MTDRRQQLLSALDKADAAGDTEAAQYFASQLKQLSPTVHPSTAPAAPTQPQEEGSFFGNMGKGAISHLANIGQTILKPAGWFSPEAKAYLARSKAISDELNENTGAGGFIGGLAVDIAGTGGLYGLAKKGLMKAGTMLPKAARYLTATPTVAATEGGLAGAYLSPDDPLKGALYGGVGGAAGQQILSKTLGRLGTPINLRKFSDTDALMTAGVPMTIGMGANPNTITGRGLRLIEETLSSAPIIGGGIKGQRELARQAFRDIPLEEAARTAGVPAPSRTGFTSHADMQAQIKGAIGQKYDQLLSGRALRPTGVLKRNLSNIVDDPKLSMTQADRARAKALVEAHIFGRQIIPGQTAMPHSISATDIFKAQSDLRQLGHRAMQSELSSERAYGEALIGAADEIYGFIQRRFPQIGRELQNLRAPYAELSTLRAAAQKAGPRGEFSPAQLGKAASQRGNTQLTHYAAMAEPLLTKDPGNLSNLARLSLLTGGGILLGSGAIYPAAAAAILMGTKSGQKLLQGNTALQKRVADLVAQHPETINQITSLLGRQTGLNLSN